MAIELQEIPWPYSRSLMLDHAQRCGRDDVSGDDGRGTTHHATCDCSLWKVRVYIEALEAEVRRLEPYDMSGQPWDVDDLYEEDGDATQ